MRRLLAILAASLWACTAGAAQSTKDEVHFRATVQDVGLLSHFSGKAILIGFDPRFALTVRIESAAPAVPGFTSGAIVTFGIHSPVMLFGVEGDTTKGKTYDFSVVRTSKKGKIRFSSLQVLGVPADKSAPADPAGPFPRVSSMPRASAKGDESRIVLAFGVPRLSSLNCGRTAVDGTDGLFA